MKTSETVKNIAPALLKAQKLMGGAKKGASNSYFKSKYADLGAVLEASKEILNENGVLILQPHGKDQWGAYVETILLHESGEWVSSETRVVYSKEGDPQAQGSAITYARRYGLQSLLSMPAEDDDGEKAMTRTSGYNKASTPQATLSGVITGPATSAVTTAEPNGITHTLVTQATTEAPKRTSFRKPPKTTATNGAASTPTDAELGLE